LKYHTIIAGIALPNEPSVRLHDKFGFKKVAHFAEVGNKFGKWVDVGFWQKLTSQLAALLPMSLYAAGLFLRIPPKDKCNFIPSENHEVKSTIVIYTVKSLMSRKRRMKGEGGSVKIEGGKRKDAFLILQAWKREMIRNG
jgi:hypothetical protein